MNNLVTKLLHKIKKLKFHNETQNASLNLWLEMVANPLLILSLVQTIILLIFFILNLDLTAPFHSNCILLSSDEFTLSIEISLVCTIHK